MKAARGAGSPVSSPAAALALAALLWGVAEASWFFLVADILLTFTVLLFGLRSAFVAALAAALGASIGGALLYRLGASDPSAATAHLLAVPFLSPEQLRRGFEGMASANWPLAMLKGSFTGIPYKIYAAAAGGHGIAAPLFLAATVPIRLVRFTLAILATAAIDRIVPARIGQAGRIVLLAAFWMAFYAEFWFRWSGWERALMP